MSSIDDHDDEIHEDMHDKIKSSDQNQFWNSYDKRFSAAIINEAIINETPATIVDFVTSMLPVYELVRKGNPQAVFVPDRGAAPLGWTIQTIAEIRRNVFNENQKPLLLISLPIGTHVNVINAREGGYGYTAKVRIVEKEIINYREAGLLVDPATHVVLLDEAQSGSTSATATLIIKQILENPKLTVTYVPCKDERNIKIRKSHASYQKLATGEVQGVEGSSIPVPMFYIDRSIFLPILVSPTNKDGTSPEGRELMTMKIHNTNAEKAFRMITILSLIPEVTHALVTEGLSEANLAENLVPYYLEVRDWARSIFETYPDVEDEKQRTTNINKRTHVVKWVRAIDKQINPHLYQAT